MSVREETIKRGRAMDRFNANIAVVGACWVYQCAPDRKGYRRFRDDTGRSVFVHRYAYEAFRGPIAAGLTIDHLCRNRACCNPAHLEPVTAAENTKRGEAGKWLSEKTHCPRGHEYSESNTYHNKGKRVCRECKRIHSRNARLMGKTHG